MSKPYDLVVIGTGTGASGAATRCRAAGWRVAVIDHPRGGVTTVKGRLALNEFLQNVSNSTVYAVGDAASSGPPLTPVSSHDAKVAAANNA